MKRMVWFTFLSCGIGLSCWQLIAEDQLNGNLPPKDDGSATTIVIKNGMETNHFVTLGNLLFPEYVEAKGIRYLLDYGGKPDLKDFSPIVWWGDVREMRLYVAGTLEFRLQKGTEKLQPVIVVKTLASGPMPVGQKGTESEFNPFDNPFTKSSRP